MRKEACYLGDRPSTRSLVCRSTSPAPMLRRKLEPRSRRSKALARPPATPSTLSLRIPPVKSPGVRSPHPAPLVPPIPSDPAPPPPPLAASPGGRAPAPAPAPGRRPLPDSPAGVLWLRHGDRLDTPALGPPPAGGVDALRRTLKSWSCHKSDTPAIEYSRKQSRSLSLLPGTPRRPHPLRGAAWGHNFEVSSVRRRAALGRSSMVPSVRPCPLRRLLPCGGIRRSAARSQWPPCGGALFSPCLSRLLPSWC